MSDETHNLCAVFVMILLCFGWAYASALDGIEEKAKQVTIEIPAENKDWQWLKI